jgi:hypothetical protein
MRMLKTIVPALIALVVLMTGAPAVAAQDTDPAMPEMDIEGLEKMYGRMFNGDMMAMIETPEGEATGWFMLTTMVLEFDSEDNAKAGFERLNEESTSGAEGEDVELEDVELDLDMDYMAKQAVDESEGMTTNMVVVTAQDGEYVYAVSGMTFGDDPTELVESTVKDMKDADTSDDEEMFHEDGTSMGGLWAKLPTVEHVQEQIPALSSVSDIVYYPAQESTPAA